MRAVRSLFLFKNIYLSNFSSEPPNYTPVVWGKAHNHEA